MKPNQRYIYYKSLEHKVSVQEFVACSYETHSWWRCAAALETQGQRQEATLPPPPQPVIAPLHSLLSGIG